MGEQKAYLDASPTIHVLNRYAIDSPLQPHPPLVATIVEKNYNFEQANRQATSREKGKLVLQTDVGHSNTFPIDLMVLTPKREIGYGLSLGCSI